MQIRISRNSFKKYLYYAKMFLKWVNWSYGSTAFSYLFLNLEEAESDENDGSNIEILHCLILRQLI